jgi:hypothetical protein
MDALSALGLAGNIVQFVSFSHEIVSLGKEIYKSASGTRAESLELESIIQDLSAIHGSLRDSWAGRAGRHSTLPKTDSHSRQEATLVALIDQCDPIYTELKSVLEKLHVQGEHRKWKSFSAAVKFLWKEDEIKDLEKRICKLQCQIDSNLISGIR